MIHCESSSAGRASRCQRGGRRFESDLSLKASIKEALNFGVVPKR